jgi:hypothetical protein
MNSIPRTIPALGLYPYTYAVDDIATAISLDEDGKMKLMSEFAKAIHTGALQVREAKTGGEFTVTPNMANASPYVTIDDVNNWLKKSGYNYRWLAKGHHDDEDRQTVPVVAPSIEAWRANARKIGEKIRNKNPSLNIEQIAEKTRKEMIERNTKGELGMSGRGNKVPSAETIKRHALIGIKS